MNSVLMTGEIPGLFAKDEMMAMTADLRNSFLKVSAGIRFSVYSFRLYGAAKLRSHFPDMQN